MFELRNKVVLISGASSGIGAEMARQLVDHGAKVGLLARREHLLRDLADELCIVGTVAWKKADVCDEEALRSALDELAEELGGVDVIVANAGYALAEAPHQLQQGAAQKMYDTNFFGILRMIDWAVPKFHAQGHGHIVGMASMASYLGMPYSSSYSGSKAAARIHLQGLRIALRPHNISVTTLCPGFVESPMTNGADFPTPFMLKTDVAVARMIKAIKNQEGEVAFPWQMKLVIGVARRALPTSLTERLLGLGSKKSANGLRAGARRPL